MIHLSTAGNILGEQYSRRNPLFMWLFDYVTFLPYVSKKVIDSVQRQWYNNVINLLFIFLWFSTNFFHSFPLYIFFVVRYISTTKNTLTDICIPINCPESFFHRTHTNTHEFLNFSQKAKSKNKFMIGFLWSTNTIYLEKNIKYIRKYFFFLNANSFINVGPYVLKKKT